ncbi:50S ribosomal protein L4 [Thermodesulfobacteriota bacterium]
MKAMDVYNLQKEKVAEVELRDDIFNVPVKKNVLHQVVVSQLSNQRAGTASTKNRSGIKASGSKLWRQKGTGRARVGSASSPTRRGGGVAFGPSPRKYLQKVNRKVKKLAVCMALSDKAMNDQLILVDDFSLSEIKTKHFLDIMENFKVNKALIVTQDKKSNLERSSKNVPWVKVLRCEGINVYDILKYDHLFLEQSALGKIEEALVS